MSGCREKKKWTLEKKGKLMEVPDGQINDNKG